MWIPLMMYKPQLKSQSVFSGAGGDVAVPFSIWSLRVHSKLSVSISLPKRLHLLALDENSLEERGSVFFGFVSTPAEQLLCFREV